MLGWVRQSLRQPTTRAIWPRDKIAAMKLSINGECRQFPAPLTVAELIETLGYTGKRIALERNGEIVPKGRHVETLLADGDQIEIVVAVGGG